MSAIDDDKEFARLLAAAKRDAAKPKSPLKKEQPKVPSPVKGRSRVPDPPEVEETEEVVELKQIRTAQPLKMLAADIPPGTTMQQVEVFLSSIRGSADLSSAARFARLRPHVVEQWITKGAIETSGWFHHFFEEYEYARGVLGVGLNLDIRKASKNPAQWRAAAYLGSQRLPESFTDPKEGGGNIQVGVQVVNRVTPEQAQRLDTVPMERLAQIAKKGAAPPT